MNTEITEVELEEFYKQIGANVAKHRKQKGMSQLDLSLAMGQRSISVVSKAENYSHKKKFNLEHIYKIAKVLDIEPHELLKK